MVLGRPSEVLGLKPRLAANKASTLPDALSLLPDNFSLIFAYCLYVDNPQMYVYSSDFFPKFQSYVQLLADV